VAQVQPFRAARFDETKAGPLATLVAPPYDVLDAEARAEHLRRSPYNVVHLTLPESEEDAARKWREWNAEGVLVREEVPAVWVLEQEYVGPDGVARTRRGLVASLKVEPYETRSVLPHERTHAEAREGRLRLVKAVGAQLEPIFLLYDGPPPVAVGDAEPDLEVEGARLWRVPDVDVSDAFAGRQLLIADGHHRYETTVAYAQSGGSPWMMVVLVSTDDPGLTIFPTHRLFANERLLSQNGSADPAEALRELKARPPRPAAAVQVTPSGAAIVEGAADELDVHLVDRLGHEGISYTPDADEAIRRVRGGEAQVAYLMRPTRIEDVFEYARRGEVMPPKTTYFYPKLLSGLLFHPLD
jgi:uncharacterized protein (DUF1015 family)